jgi:sugar phosphate isomerase/epimerase
MNVAHNPYVFWDPKMLRFYLGAIQFALGDLAAPTIPSARLTPSIRAQEKLGWRLGMEGGALQHDTLFEVIDKTARLGLPYLGGRSSQKVSQDITKNFGPDLTDDELKQVRLKLDAVGVRLLTCYVPRIPGDAPGCRGLFEFGRKMGIETFITEPGPQALDTVEEFCDRYDIQVALRNPEQKTSQNYWNPEGILQACQGRSKRIGACADIGNWLRSGIDPVEGVRELADRLLIVRLHDLTEATPEGLDVPWGTGVGRSEAVVREIRRLGLRPTMFGIDYSGNGAESLPEIARCIEFFNLLTLNLIH